VHNSVRTVITLRYYGKRPGIESRKDDKPVVGLRRKGTHKRSIYCRDANLIEQKGEQEEKQMQRRRDRSGGLHERVKGGCL